jgi:hypothetical protein
VKAIVSFRKTGLILFFLVSPALVAVEPELAANLGIATNTQTSYVFPGGTLYSQANGKEPYLSLKFLLNFDSLQFGGLIGYTSPHISYKENTGNEFKAFLARPLVPVALLANKKFQLGENHTLYGGLALGVGISIAANVDAAQGQYSIGESTVMPLLGAQAGYVYFIGRVGFNAEISVMGLPEWSGNADKYGYSIYAFTAGMRLRL